MPQEEDHAMSKLDTAHGPYVDLVGLGRVFVVPDYQRAYSWKAKKQVAELWSDVLRLYRNLVDDQHVGTHFIGSVVIGQASTKALGPVQCPVIDGQQRLVTLSLIIAAIRNELVADASDRAEITAQYLAHFKVGKVSTIRVRPGEKDRAAFDAIMKDEGDTVEHGLVRRAYEYIVGQLAEGPTEYRDADADESEDVEPVDEPEEDEQADYDEEVDNVVWDWEALLSVVGTQLELVSISDVPPESAYQ